MNLTHVFFAKSDDPKLNTQIENFASYTFFGHGTNTGYSQLKFVEFPDSLLSIGSDCFARCSNLDYSVVNNDPNARISGANIETIGNQAFLLAFTTKNISDFIIGSSVTSIGESAFRNMGLTYSNLLIGSADNLSQLGFPVGFNNKPRFNGAADVVFHSDVYDATDIEDLSVYFQNSKSLTIY
jgi:hypothetical protein